MKYAKAWAALVAAALTEGIAEGLIPERYQGWAHAAAVLLTALGVAAAPRNTVPFGGAHAVPPPERGH